MLSSFTISLLCGMAFAVDAIDHIDTKVVFKNIYHMSGATLLPGYGGGEILKAGGQIAWEIKTVGEGADAKDGIYIYQTIGVNIDQFYGQNAHDDNKDDTDAEKSGETTEEEDDPIESPVKARIQVGLCSPRYDNLDEADLDFMICSLVEFQKDTKKILMRNWEQTENAAYPTVTDMTQSLTDPIWTAFFGQEHITVNADLIIDTDTMAVTVNTSDNLELDHSFGIATKHVAADWDNKLEITFYELIKDSDFINKVKNEGLTWNGRQYLSAFDQQELDDDYTTGYANMSISTVKYGIAKEGVTKGDDSWAQDTKVCNNAAGYLAASLGSFALALAAINF